MRIRTSVSAVRRTFALLGALVLVWGVVPPRSAAPVSAATIDVPYTQNFDTLPASGSATWVSDSTIPGWFHARTGTGTTIVAHDGSSNAGNLYSYGTGTATDRALGSLGSGNAAIGNMFWGYRLQNDTGVTITSLDVSFVGEQWRNSGAAAQTLTFAYLVGNPTVTGSLAEFQSAGVGVATLDFTSPVTGGAAGALNGNLTANRTPLTTTITGLSIPAGTELMLRWSDPDQTGADHGLAIDDFSVTPHSSTVTPNLSIDDVSQAESEAGTTTFTFTVSLSAPAPAGGVTFDIATTDGTAVQPGDYAAKSLTGQSIAATGTSYTFDVAVNSDTTVEPDETFFVNVTNVTGATVTDGQGQGTIQNDDTALIHDVQGNGAATPIPGSTVRVEGVVVANFQGTGKLQGFFLEEEDADFDADPATSEGIFVFCNACPTAVAEGQRVQVTGTVSEFNAMTQITAGTAESVVVTDAGNHLAEVTPAPIDLPVVGVVNDFYETREGMKVTFVDTLTVSEYFELARFGHITLVEGGRPEQFTETNTPSVPGLAAHLDNLARREVILDDDNNAQQAYLNQADGSQAIYHPRANGGFGVGTQGTDFFRGGDTVRGLTGVLHWSFPGTGPNTWRIRPTAANPTTFTVANPRPATPPAVGGAIKAVSMNLLNYFTTIDTTSSSSTGPCGPSGTLDCRGADSGGELNRQRERLSIVICNLSADVYGLMELENTTASATITNLLGALNARCGGAHPYAFVNTGGTLGTDAIRVGLIYRTGVLSPVGDPLVDLDPIHNRPPTAQTFDVVDASNLAFGERFTVVANHFKSKGCDAEAVGADADAGDGQSCYNGRRTDQASRLLTWINGTVLPAAGDPDVLLLGDLNSYSKEDPIATLVAGGYTDLAASLLGPGSYSFLFDGQLGHLDYALATSGLASKVTGIGNWHIDADEVPLFDYNDEVRDTPGEASFEEEPDGSALVPPRVVFQPASPYRASDHDPVIVGLFSNVPPTVTVPADITVFATSASGATVTYSATATDPQDGLLTPVCNPPSGSNFSIATTTVTCTATDSAGASTQASFNVTVLNNSPVLTVPADITVPATGSSGAAVPFTATATDIEDGSITPDCTPPSGSTFPIGTTTVTCTATDSGDESDSATFTVTVENNAPVVTVPDDITVDATGASGAAVTFTTTAADIEDGAITPDCTPPSGSTFPIGTTTVTCTATDSGDESDSATFSVSVLNNAPVLTVPANTTVTATSTAGAVVTFNATATDVEDGGAPVVCTPASGSTFAIGTTTVNCTATDTSGATASGSFVVTVVNTPPVITAPAGPVTAVASSAAGAVVTFTVTASDVEQVAVTVTCTPPRGSTFPVGTTTVNCTATDANGATTTASFAVTVTAPTTPPASGTLTVIPNPVLAGATAMITADGFDPGEPVTVQLFSSPITIATPSASSTGTLNATITIPADTAAGNHQLVATGTISGRTRSATITVTVISRLPDTGTSPTALSVIAITLLAAGLALRRRSRRST